MEAKKLKNILEAGLLVAGRTMSVAQLEALFQHEEGDKPDRKQIRATLLELQSEYEGRGIELVEVASGFRLQSHESVADYVSNLFQERAPRYSRALLETLVLIAYRQPITRAEIEDVRGVAVSSNIIKTLQERQWVKVLGHKDVPGRPALLGTTKEFLDYFNLRRLDDLPPLADIKDLDQFDALIAEEVGQVQEPGEAANEAAPEEGEQDGVEGDAAAGNTTMSASVDVDVVGDNAAEGSGAAGDAGPDMPGDGQSASDADDAAVQQSSEAVSDHDNENEATASTAKVVTTPLVGLASKLRNSDNAEQLDSDDPVAVAEFDPVDAVDVELGAEDSAAEDVAEMDDSGQDDAGPDEPMLDEDGYPISADQTLTGAEEKLLQVISDFADEHQDEIDARDELEARTLSSPVGATPADDDNAGTGDTGVGDSEETGTDIDESNAGDGGTGEQDSSGKILEVAGVEEITESATATNADLSQSVVRDELHPDSAKPGDTLH